MKGYLELLDNILLNGVQSDDRTGTGTTSIFGTQTRYDLSYSNLPVVTSKFIHLPSVIHELLWFLRGDTNTEYLTERGVKIWDAWSDAQGELGKVYGHQWRSWGAQLHSPGLDQIANVIQNIKDDPYSRRHIVSAWNPGELDQMALPPCHLLFQFYVRDGQLSCHLYQRSADAFLGIPFNITSYSLLTHMIAHVTGLRAHEFIHTIGDIHIYNNHREQVELQLKRREVLYSTPTVLLRPEIECIDDFTYPHDIKVVDYKYHRRIRGKISV